MGAQTIAVIDQTPVPFASAAELLQSITTALAGLANVPDLFRPTHGHRFLDNTETVYSDPLPAPLLQQIDLGVQRFSASLSALAYFEHYSEPTGDLRIPMLRLSTSRDPAVPAFHQSAYLDAVTADGSSDLLVQREIERCGHCVFQPGELAAAFSDLVAWSSSGSSPRHERPRCADMCTAYSPELPIKRPDGSRSTEVS